MTKKVTISSLLCGALVLGCVERPLAVDATGDGGSSTSGAGGASSGPPTSSGQAGSTGPQAGTTSGTTEAQPGPTTGSTGADSTTVEETCGFICDGTTTSSGTLGRPCSTHAQDCSEGEKCAPYAEGGGSVWNATKCVPVTGDNKPDEPCMTMGGGVSGLDDCEVGAFCWDVDETEHGTCIGLCSGSEAAPDCKDPDKECVGGGVLSLCLLGCDPLLQDCPGEDLCILHADVFICVIDFSGDTGAALDPCDFANACDKGLLCLNPTAAEECDPNAGGCCLPFCDLTKPDMCPGVSTVCTSLYEEGMAPPKYENVGICVEPG